MNFGVTFTSMLRVTALYILGRSIFIRAARLGRGIDHSQNRSDMRRDGATPPAFLPAGFHARFG